MSLNRDLEGRRIKLMSCDDPYTQLTQGDIGTIKYVRLDDLWGDTSIAVNWDSGSTLSLIEGKDNFVILPEGEEDGD